MRTGAQTSQDKTSALKLLIVWSFVGIPLLIGVSQTLVNAMKLFR
jgi:hypothetical protein